MASVQNASAAVVDLPTVAAALAMPMVKPLEAPAAAGLPTPSSLPTVAGLANDPAVESPSADVRPELQGDDRMERSASESAGEEEPEERRGEVNVFAFEAGDVEMAEGQGVEDAAGELQSTVTLDR